MGTIGSVLLASAGIICAVLSLVRWGDRWTRWLSGLTLLFCVPWLLVSLWELAKEVGRGPTHASMVGVVCGSLILVVVLIAMPGLRKRRGKLVVLERVLLWVVALTALSAVVYGVVSLIH